MSGCTITFLLVTVCLANLKAAAEFCIPCSCSWCRYIVVAVFAGLFVLGAVFAAELKPPEEQSSWFPDDHLYSKAQNWQDDHFAEADTDQVAKVTFVWGLKVPRLPRSRCRSGRCSSGKK